LLAILERALADARGQTASGVSGTSSASYWERCESMRFLCDQRGPRAVWRRTLLGLVGIDVEGFDRLVEEERHRWPELGPEPKHGGRGPAAGTRKTYQTEEERLEARRAQDRAAKQRARDEAAAERRREQARICMANKRAREREAAQPTPRPPESYVARALLVGTALTAPTYRD
jgi:hypothetical protein